MAHLYKAVEWQSGSGRWYVNDVSEPSAVSSCWWTPVRILKITPAEYAKMLVQTFHAVDVKYIEEFNMLIFSFLTQEEARKYKNYINAKARRANYICGHP